LKNRIEQVILENLIKDDTYVRKVIPFLKPEYFMQYEDKKVFDIIFNFVEKYNNPPSKQAIILAVNEDTSLNEDSHVKCMEVINTLNGDEVNRDWLIDETEKFCKDKALYLGVMESIQIIDGKNKDKSTDALPSILSEALSVGFDTNIGHDFIEDAEKRYDFYHRIEEKVEFDLDMFNKITEGGLSNKTLNIALAGTGVGKSLFMCHMASAAISKGKNVLYITLEMSEERIAERIDANLMNLPIQELSDLSKAMYDDRIKKINDKIEGRLIIKEYPTASAHSGHFKALINELKLKRSFFPDIIFIDYLNICSSSRFRPGSSANSYTIIKSIAEELRGLAVEQNVPIVSATQTTRGGYDNSDVSLTDTSESFGLPATADLMFAIISTEELEQMGQFMIKQLKNRYADPTRNKRFMIGVDRSRMKLFDLDPSAQTQLTDANIDIPVFDSGQTENKYDGFKF
jgi:replicative DNA helicase|tara:strand:- start:5232 stop:6608 length:1377 start_codon:yes stop_codon:yes gene_type:complete